MKAQMESPGYLLSYMRRLWQEGAPEPVCAGLLSALLYEVNALAPPELPSPDPTPHYMQKLMDYIVEHTEADLTTDALARRFYIGKSKLCEDFRAATGLTLHDYVTSIRLWRIKSMLAQDVPLPLIAGQCGFSGASALITMFRREVGMTPGEWQRRQDSAAAVKKCRLPFGGRRRFLHRAVILLRRLCCGTYTDWWRGTTSFRRRSGNCGCAVSPSDGRDTHKRRSHPRWRG